MTKDKMQYVSWYSDRFLSDPFDKNIMIKCWKKNITMQNNSHCRRPLRRRRQLLYSLIFGKDVFKSFTPKKPERFLYEKLSNKDITIYPYQKLLYTCYGLSSTLKMVRYNDICLLNVNAIKIIKNRDNLFDLFGGINQFSIDGIAFLLEDIISICTMIHKYHGRQI